MPSPTIKPTLKVVTAKTPKATGSSWPHPSKALEATLTKHSPVFPNTKDKCSPRSSPEQPFLVHPLVALVPLSTISELPRLDLLEGFPDPDPPARNRSFEEAGRGEPAAAKPDKAGIMNQKEVKQDQLQGAAVSPSILPFAPSAGAASIPLPQSPILDDGSKSSDHRQSSGSEGDTGSPSQLGSHSDKPKSAIMDESNGIDGERENTGPSRVASMLPQWIADQLPRQDSGMPSARTSRAPSVFPGAYPKSDSMEDSPIPSPGPTVEVPELVAGQSETGFPQSADKGVRPRKSVSIALPGADDESKKAPAAKRSSTQPEKDGRTKLADALSMRENIGDKEDNLAPEKNETVENEHPQAVDPGSTEKANGTTESEQSRETVQGETHESPCVDGCNNNQRRSNVDLFRSNHPRTAGGTRNKLEALTKVKRSRQGTHQSNKLNRYLSQIHGQS